MTGSTCPVRRWPGVAMFLLVFPLAQGHELGWPGWLPAMLAAAVAVLAVFAWHQVRRSGPAAPR